MKKLKKLLQVAMVLLTTVLLVTPTAEGGGINA